MNVVLWGHGQRYFGSIGALDTGNFITPVKAPSLLKDGALFLRSRPQYKSIAPSGFIVATDNNLVNDGTGDQASAINAFLLKAAAASLIAFFPAGIYQVGSTVFIPTGSKIQGSLWSQIQGSGFFFSDLNNPQVMV
jgi:hypothetical protein